MYLAIKHFRHFLEGRQFHILTDYRPLTFAFNTRCDRHSPRQVRQHGCITQITSTIEHIKGADNVVADALSRVHTNPLLLGKPPTVDFAVMAEALATDAQIRSLQLDLCGQALMLTSDNRLELAYNANAPRSNDIPRLLLHPSQSLMLILISSTLTW